MLKAATRRQPIARGLSPWSLAQQLRPKPRRKRSSFRNLLCLLRLTEFRRRRRPRSNRIANRRKKLLLPGRRTQTQQPRRPLRNILEKMRRIRRHIDRLTGPHRQLIAPKPNLSLTLEYAKHLLEVVPMRRRPAPWRYEHIDEAVTPRGVRASEQDRVRIA
jgi:hypothetical protein